ncbi:alkaline phosphatase family protein [Elusimicrobiota bacterium]
MHNEDKEPVLDTGAEGVEMAEEKNKPLVVLGLDGADFTIIERFIDSGSMPNIKKAMDSGVFCKMKTVIPPVTAPAWASFMTGVNPGKHGLFDFMRLENDYSFKPVSSIDIKVPAVWDIISAENKKVAIINVPMTYPPHKVNGVMIGGMLTPKDAIDKTYPEEYWDEVKKEFEYYEIFPSEVYSPNNINSFSNTLFQSVKTKHEYLKHLIEKGEYDLIVFVVNETDIAQHGLMHTICDSHPNKKFAKDKSEETVLEKLYERIDMIVGYLIDSNTDFMIMSDHGSGPLLRFFNMNNFLIKEKFIKVKRSPLSILKFILFKMGFTPKNVYKILLRLKLGRLRRDMDKRRKGYRLMRKLFFSFDDVDWSRTSAYSFGATGPIRLNKKGREPEGVVEESAEDKILDSIEQKLRKIKGLDLTSCYRKEDIYNGKYVEDAADMICFFDGLETISFADFEFASHKLFDRAYAISGHHRMEGVFIGHGPVFSEKKEIAGVNIQDITPVILSYFGYDKAEYMDGKVPVEIFKEKKIMKKLILKQGTMKKNSGIYSEEDEEEIKKRLKDLGYI